MASKRQRRRAKSLVKGGATADPCRHSGHGYCHGWRLHLYDFRSGKRGRQNLSAVDRLEVRARRERGSGYYAAGGYPSRPTSGWSW